MPHRFRFLLQALPLIAVLVLLGLWLVSGLVSAPRGTNQPHDAFNADPVLRVMAASTAEVPALIRLACDADWRVRAAAFAALDELHRFERLPARDTPMAQRETLLLNWLDRHAGAVRYDLCDVFARAPTAQFGATLVADCLGCHAGPVTRPDFVPERCVACHSAAHEEWAASAHASSLTHLSLATVDPVTRVQGTVDFAGRRGMSCTACHEPTSHHAASSPPGCVAQFTARRCNDCHIDADDQWERWKAGPRFQKASWPPGSLEPAPAGNARSCVECHMPQGSHAFSARRNPVLLADGLDISLTRDASDGITLTLTNLSGHHYPTGSTRRALEVWVGLDDADKYLLATLAPSSMSRDTAPPGTALRPAEQRRWVLPGQPTRVTCRIVYVRDRFSPNSYRTEVASVTRQFQQTLPSD